MKPPKSFKKPSLKDSDIEEPRHNSQIINLEETILPALILNRMKREAEHFESLSNYAEDDRIATMARAMGVEKRAEIRIIEEHGFDALNKIKEEEA